VGKRQAADARRVIRCLLEAALLVGLVAAAPAPARDAGARPEINEAYQNRDFREWVETFERPGREVYDRRHDIIAATGVQAGMDVADVGAGTGLFTRLFARAVEPEGTVYAVHVVESFVRNVVQRARDQGLDNVRGVVNDQSGVGLAENSVDLVFISDTYHHFEQPRAMLTSIRRALRPDGTLVVIDFRRRPGASSPWVMEHVRAGRETVIAEIEAAGFRLEEDVPLLERNYFLRFRPESPR